MRYGIGVRAADTNVIVRFLTADDPKQFRQATRLVENNRLFVSVTVLLEAEWVLRRAYRFTANRIIEEFRRLAGLATISLEDTARVAEAFTLAEAGLDFADALHLARSFDCDDFVTFDRAFARAARGKSSIPVLPL